MLTNHDITELEILVKRAENNIYFMRKYLNLQSATPTKSELLLYLREVEEASANLENASNTLIVEQEEVLNTLSKSTLPEPVKPIPPRGRMIRENSDKPLCECGFVARGVAHKCDLG
jgi:hypothetical protein